MHVPSAGTERVVLFKRLVKLVRRKPLYLGGGGILKKNNLQDVWRDKHPTARQYTWVRYRVNRLQQAFLCKCFYLCRKILQ